ncbi:MAG: hypothetical protein JSR21_04450 [Proteobacteria bacterium]|nr:hypothetical protein [Pseudomonadota bacterium]
MSSAWMPRGLRRLRTLSDAPSALPRRMARAGAAAFADAVRARHAARAASAPGPEQAMRRRSTPAPSWTQHVHLHAAARRIALSLRLQPLLRLRADAAPAAPWRPAYPAAPPARPPVSAHTRLIERVVAREHRVHSVVTARELMRDAAAPPPAARADAPPSAPRAQPVLMAVRRAPAPPAAPPSAAASTTHDAPPPVPLRARLVADNAVRAAAPGAIPLSLGEIGRLTDHVVRAIDRRALAERERRGGV